MMTTELGSCEWFVWDLRRSNLIDRGELDQVLGDFLKKHPRSEPPDLAQYLVGQGVLTQFQADRILQGKTQGLVLGPYKLVDALGTGSMGTVYKALSKTAPASAPWQGGAGEGQYAVKVLPRRSMWNVRIARRQVRAFEQCRHPAVVPFVDVGTSGGMHYLVWTLVEGETLESLVQRHGKLPAATAAHYAVQTAEGLNECHQHSLIHGLLKPSNIMVGLDQQVRILDFGIGALLAESEGESLVDTMSTANSLTSGLDCNSPESIMEPTNRTPAGDQYSLGCVLYYCLTGKYPFPEGSAVEKMMAHQMKQPVPIRELAPDVPEELAEVVNRLMQKSPEARFGRMAEAVLALRPFADTARTSARPALRPAAAPAPRPEGARRGYVEPPQADPGLVSQTPMPAGALPTRAGLRGTLPNRGEVVRGNPAAPPAPPAPAPQPAAAAPVRARPVPPPEAPRQTLEERLGPRGIVLATVLIGALTWLAAWYLRLLH